MLFKCILLLLKELNKKSNTNIYNIIIKEEKGNS
jgi:hypothetical protein